MYQPQGFEKGEKGELACELLQSLYGLTSSARIWYDTFAAAMKDFGFRVSPFDSGLWIHLTRKNFYVTSHVDDFKIVCENISDKEWLIEQLNSKFEIKIWAK